MYFTEQGDGPATALFLHGNLSSSRWWEKVFQLLPPAVRAIAPDLRGFGRSEAPPVDYSLEHMVTDVAVLADRLQLREFALVGHSLGGAVALQYVLSHRPRVSALVLVDPVPANGLHFGEEVFDLLTDMKASPAGMKKGLQGIAPTAPDDGFFDGLIEEALHAAPQAFQEIPKATAGFDVSARLSEITCPTLCLSGDRDRLIPREDIARMCALIPNCQWVEMRGIGHCPSIEAPEEFTNLLVDFLWGVRPQDFP